MRVHTGLNWLRIKKTDGGGLVNTVDNLGVT
jgi:hypothetical protein